MYYPAQTRAQWLVLLLLLYKQLRSFTRRWGRSVAVLLVTASLVACGGGGGDTGAPSGGSTPPVTSGGTTPVSNGGTSPVVTSAPTLVLLAGNLGGAGNVDGTGAAARFNHPVSITVDSTGNAYVADGSNNTIRKITPAGEVTTLAGTAGASGSADGTGTAARFDGPDGITVDSSGNLFVADFGNHTIRKITPVGVVTTLAGTAGAKGSTDGAGAAARFSNPYGVTVDSSGNVYVADTYNHTIRKITPVGVVTTLAGTAGVIGFADGTGAAARFDRPGDVTVDGTGNVYVADFGNQTIRKITPAGVVTRLTHDTFYGPRGVTVDSTGNVYVADTSYHTIRKITPAGVVTTLAGTLGEKESTDGTGAAARFDQPGDVTVDGTGNVYVADTFNHTIRKITPAGVVTTLAGLAGAKGWINGTGAGARFNSPGGVTVDSTGNVLVADVQNHTIRKITPAGVVSTLAGTAGASGSTDGTGAAARFNRPYGVAVDSSGNFYVADSGNGKIRKITQTGVVTTLDPWAAQFGDTRGVTVDSSGNVFATVTFNHIIRKITPLGEVTALAGGAMLGSTIGADGVGAAAHFNNPQGIAVDSTGNLFVADTYNNTIRKITPVGVVTTLAGTAGAEGSADGIGAAARFNRPDGVTVDSTGNVYVADTGNHTIRKISPAGVVSTVVGVAGQRGGQLGTLPGKISEPRGLAITGRTLYFTSSNGVAVVYNLP